MTKDDRFMQKLQARRKAEEQMRQVRQTERDAYAADMLTGVTPGYAEKATVIGWGPSTVVVSERKAGAGRIGRVYGYRLGVGWIVAERPEDTFSSSTVFLAMLEGDWVDLGRTPWRRLRGGDILPGLPEGLDPAGIVVLDPGAEGIVSYRPRSATRTATAQLIEELYADGPGTPDGGRR
jgi:hypothetical protein